MHTSAHSRSSMHRKYGAAGQGTVVTEVVKRFALIKYQLICSLNIKAGKSRRGFNPGDVMWQ